MRAISRGRIREVLPDSHGRQSDDSQVGGLDARDDKERKQESNMHRNANFLLAPPSPLLSLIRSIPSASSQDHHKKGNS